MRTDGVFKVKVIKLKDWPNGKTLQLIPFGDIHHDSPAFAADAFQKFLDYAKKQENALFLGMGDYFDGFSTSERAIIYDRNLHESTLKRQEKEAVGRIDRLADELEFMRGRLIGLMGGNHFSQFLDGTTGDMKLAERLGTVYLGSCCAIRIVFQRAGARDTTVCDIFAHHGKGGGTTAGGRFNSVDKMASVCEADIYLMGDNHARGCFPAGDRLFISTGNGAVTIKSKSRWIGRTGSFLRGYVENESSYVVDGCMPPANLGWIEFNITPRRDQTGNFQLEIGAKQ